MKKLGINIKECPDTNGKIKKFVKEKLKSSFWAKQNGCKKYLLY